jgi:hypothetical protein
LGGNVLQKEGGKVHALPFTTTCLVGFDDRPVHGVLRNLGLKKLARSSTHRLKGWPMSNLGFHVKPAPPCRTTPASAVPPGSLPGWILATAKGRTCAVAGRKVTWMFNGSAACISLTPQLHASYPHCNFLKVCTVVVSLETVSGHRVLAGSAMALQQIAPFCSSK